MGGRGDSMSGIKHDAGKLPFELLPWDAISEVAAVLRFGAGKYGVRNWERGLMCGRLYGALLRHVSAWWQGEDCDPETGLSHMAHASCCALMLLAYDERGRRDLDDRPVLAPGDTQRPEAGPAGVEPAPTPVDASDGHAGGKAGEHWGSGRTWVSVPDDPEAFEHCNRKASQCDDDPDCPDCWGPEESAGDGRRWAPRGRGF